jgi:hypothetical protein
MQQFKIKVSRNLNTWMCWVSSRGAGGPRVKEPWIGLLVSRRKQMQGTSAQVKDWLEAGFAKSAQDEHDFLVHHPLFLIPGHG